MADLENIDTAVKLEEDEEIQRLKKRAERFGTSFVAPQSKTAASNLDKPLSELGKKKAPKQDGFHTGVDIYTQEEQEKQRERAARFGTENSGFEYKPLVDDAEDVAKRKERAARFGTDFQATDHSGLQNQDLWEERKERGAAVERRADAVHLYGVDVMSTRDVLNYFSAFGPERVEWIDDSSCNVVFSDEITTKRAIVELGRPFAANEAPDLEGLDPSNIDNLPYLWHKGRDFRKGKKQQVPLIYRMATVEDKKGMASTKSSRYLWLNNNSRPRQRQAQRPSVQGKRKAAEFDEDGDATMGAAERKERGGRRIARRKRRRAPDGQEIEMEDAEELPEHATKEEAQDSAQAQDAQQEAGADLRGMLHKKRKPLAVAGNRLFSAAAAGILPKILQPENQDSEALGNGTAVTAPSVKPEQAKLPAQDDAAPETVPVSAAVPVTDDPMTDD